MTLTFIDTHNMVAYLSKSDASEGFDQITDFINGSYIAYALTVNPTIYVSCIKQFWRTVAVKSSNDVTRLQALVDKKKVVVTEAAIRDAFHLDDTDGVDCLPNEEICNELARMGYEKPTTKLTFYKAFFSSYSAMASTVICLSIGRKFNFSKYIFKSLVRNVDSSTKFYMYPRFITLMIQNQLGDLSTHFIKYLSPALTQKVFANIRRVGKGCLGVETPLLEGMLIARELENQVNEEAEGDDKEQGTAAEEPVTAAVDDDQSIQSPTPLTPPTQQPQDIPSTSHVQTPLTQHQSPPPAQPQGAHFPLSLLQEALDACTALARCIKHLEHDKVTQDLEILKLKSRVKKLERANKVKYVKLRRLRKVETSQRIESSADTIMEDVSNQGRMIKESNKDDAEAAKVVNEQEETKEVRVNAANAQVEGRQAEIYHIDMDHAAKVLSMKEEEEPEVQEAVEVVTTAKLITEVVAAASGTVSAAAVVYTPVTTTTITPAPVKVVVPATRRRRGVIIRDPAEESSTNTPAETKSKDKGKGILVEEPKPMKKKQQVKRKPICAEVSSNEEKACNKSSSQKKYNAKFNLNLKFLLKTKEQIEEEDSRAIVIINETSAQKATKRRRLNEKAGDVEELKKHLEIVPDEDDDVYTEATPLARKVLVMDYQIIKLDNKPRYKIIRADDTHQLYRSFITMLKIFDKEDLETLWNIVKERFSTSNPNNFSDEYLLSTLKTMFGRPDGQDNIWRNQSTVHGQALVKRWKLLTSCGVHIISFNTTQIILLVERRYPLTKFTLEQMINVVRLRVEEQSEMACPHYGFSELHQLNAFYNALNVNDQDSLNSAAGGNFLDKMPRECLKIIESKSKVCQSRAKAVIAKVGTSSSTLTISFEVSELKDLVRALLLDKKNQSSAPAQSFTPALVKAIEPNCVTCGGAHSYQNCPATSRNVYRDNIQEYVLQAAAANYNQGNTSFRPQMVANQIRPPGFPLHQNHQNNFNRGNNFNQNREGNFNQSNFNQGGNFNQGQLHRPQVNQPPAYQAPAYQAPIPQTLSVTQTDFESYIKANDAVLRNMQSQGQGVHNQCQGLQTQIANLTDMLSKFVSSNTASSSGLGTLPSNTTTNPKEDLKGITIRSGADYQGPPIPTKSKVMKQGTKAIILNKLPRKLGDPDKFLIPCEFPGMDECLELADLDFEPDPPSPFNSREVFLKDRSSSLIDVHQGELTLHIKNEAITYNLDQTVSGNPTPYDDLIVLTTSPTLTPFGDSDFLLFEEADAFLGLEDDPDSPKINPFYYDSEGDILLLEAILNSKPFPPIPNHKQY
nr:hypothetical protein [Tanacetum cinerariifolium]